MLAFWGPLAQIAGEGPLSNIAVVGVAATGLFVVAVVVFWLSFRYIPNNYVGIVEKLWSRHGSVPEGTIIAVNAEAGYYAELLRGGMHFGFWRWQYRIHRVPLVTIPQGKIGYV